MTIRIDWADDPPTRREEQPESAYQGLPEWPRWALDAHRAKVLTPADAVSEVHYAGPDRAVVETVPSSTVYRSEILLMPQAAVRRLIAPGAARHIINMVLDELNLRIEPPEYLPDELDDISYPARLVRVDASRRMAKSAPPPRSPVIDAWPVLQRLREEAGSGGRIVSDADREIVDRTSLEHLFVGAELTGVPTYSPTGPGASAGSDSGGQLAFSPYGRMPVAVIGTCPVRKDPPEGRRRPVVAVLDTGVAPHPWLENVVRPLKIGPPENAGGRQWRPTSVLNSVEDQPAVPTPMGNDVNAAYGHGTFIAGVIHQHAPNADVLMVRVLRADNVAYEGDILVGLKALLAQQVDVVVLSLGYYSESENAARYTSELASLIGSLVAKGVRVVAAAGNDSTTRRFYPAALSLEKFNDRQLVTAVGALNQNDTAAWFSNQGDYVSCWATGACVISTYPAVQGPLGAIRGIRQNEFGRETVDLDDYSSGFAMWSGTSFAAPLVAAELAKQMGFLKP